MSNTTIRVRFAPSPTGPLHIGGVRTALYNYLFAKKNNGSFILRIEDTDRQRYVSGAESYIVESLEWCGIQFTEGIHTGGPYAPYRQSERTSIYREHIQLLLDAGFAYYAFDTAEELESARARSGLKDQDRFQYNYSTRSLMKNSLSLPPEEVELLLTSGSPFAVRIKIPENEEVIFHDLIRGPVHFHTQILDDKVLFKSDGLPTYHLANVIDDYLMKITHVIRGEEWLPSAPMHLLLYRFFGWEKDMPLFAHLPLILKPEGTGKLSKRDGDRLGFPVFPLPWTDPVTGEMSKGYKDSGYLPEAFINMLSLLGWNPGTDQEIFSMEELIQHFSLDRIVKHGSRFDPEKAKWFNSQYINLLSSDVLVELLEVQLNGQGIVSSRQKNILVVNSIRNRIKLIPDFWEQSWFFYKRPTQYDSQVFKKVWQENTSGIVRDLLSLFSRQSFSPDLFNNIIQDFSTSRHLKMGQLLNPLRLLLVGSNQGPGISEIVQIIGLQEFLERIEQGLQALEKNPASL